MYHLTKTQEQIGIMLLLLSVGVLAEARIGWCQTNQFKNGDFEQGAAHWAVEPAADFAEVKVIEDISAPDGSHVLMFDHQRTRNSIVSQNCRLKPYSVYLLSWWVKAENHHRTGVGFVVSITTDGKGNSTDGREIHLSEEWQTKRRVFTTGALGKASVSLNLSSAVGKVFVDNVRIIPTTRDEARALLGSSPLIWQIPLKPNQARARITYDEIPVSDRIVSKLAFHLSENLEQNLWSNTGRLQLELPQQIDLYQAIHLYHGTGKKFKSTAEKQDLVNGYCRYTFAGSDFKGPYGTDKLYVFLTPSVPDIDGRKARFWVEWQGGGQKPVEVDCKYVKIPVVSQPKKITTGTTCYGETPPRYPDYFAMMQSLGFNSIDFWDSNGTGEEFIEDFRRHNIDVDIECSGFMVLEKRLERVEAAQAVGRNGKRRKSVVEPAHRGEIFDAFLSDMDRLAAKGFSAIMYDDEHYRDWASMDTGHSEDARKRWVQWLAQRRPDLPPVMPDVLMDDPLNHFDQYQAWWMFRASLVAEWYAAAREQFEKSVKKYNSKSTDKLWIASYTGPGETSYIKGNYANPAELAGIWDRIAPMYYKPSYDVRHYMQTLVRAVGRKYAYATLSMGQDRDNCIVWRPGEVRAQMLEVLFAGGMGYIYWSWPNANLRIIAEIAETNGVVANNEDIFLYGKSTDRFWTEQDRRFATTLETEEAGLLLVSNYTQTANNKVWLRKRPEKPMVLTEVYSGQVRRLAARQQIFSVELEPQTCQLWKWKQ